MWLVVTSDTSWEESVGQAAQASAGAVHAAARCRHSTARQERTGGCVSCLCARRVKGSIGVGLRDRGAWIFALAVVTICCGPAGAISGSPQGADGGSAQQQNRAGAWVGGMSGGRSGLLREGIVSPIAPSADVNQESIMQAVQQLSIPPV